MSYALISCHDKTGLEELAQAITSYGYKILSTGGTARHLQKCGFQVTEVAKFTESPEILGGRVKTLHPRIHAGILARRDVDTDLEDLAKIESDQIDIVVVNLYPFEETIAVLDCMLEKAIEEIDIGGVTLLRASAKNFKHVAILSSPSQYLEFIEHLKNGNFEISYKKHLATQAFTMTCKYDSAISAYLADTTKDEIGLPTTISPTLIQPLRYGENPHQKAGLYSFGLGQLPISQIQGKELSYNNILDIDAALSTLFEFDNHATVIVKHLTPCGVALGKDIIDAYKKALESDPVSAYGGIVAVNGTVDAELATEIGKLFTEVIIAKDFNDDAKKFFAKKKNLRLITFMKNQNFSPLVIRSTMLGALVQTPDDSLVSEFKIIGTSPVSEFELSELSFAMAVAKHVKSNGIAITKNFASVGIGTGQPNRVGSVRIVLDQAGNKAKGAYLASDGFIPFADSVQLSAKFGVKAIIEPGGSVNDKDVIETANKLGIGLVFSGQRHFLH
jgi:phosphoribosylaminoimidazolecarboxamide formyltransferase/IMP cyclohydrolase